ncbi:MAG: YIP1 family protein [Methanomicrobiaceae archaeon]|nr:YIP1 family protein [Methanomicrobiaceae archaeon]
MQDIADITSFLIRGLMQIPKDLWGIIRRPVTTLQNIRQRTLFEVLIFIFITALIYAILIGLTIVCGLDFLRIYTTFEIFDPIMLVFIMYALTIFNTFFNALFIHIFIIIVEGKNGLFESLKAVSYSASPTLTLGWIPVLGLITGVWALIVQTLALRELHDISTGRAVLAMILPYIIFICIFVSLFFIPTPFPIFV